MRKSERHKPNVGVLESIIVVIIILIILGYLIIFSGQSPQVPLLISVVSLMLYGIIRGFNWDEVVGAIEEGIKPGVIPLMIFLLIGVLIATWIYLGTIPTIMYFGFKIISVKYFLPTVFIVCSLVGITCGSSFTTVSTMGIAFIGIGSALKINPGITAGAIISGAYFGANVSPLSGTTNLAAGVGEIDIYEHIKSLIWTDLPVWGVVLIGYTLLGFGHKDVSLEKITIMTQQLQNGFWISFWTVLPIILLLVLAWLKVPAVPSLAFGSFFAVIIGWLHRPIKLNTLAKYIMNGYVAKTGSKTMNVLLSKGGIDSMLSSLALIIFALSLGGLLIKFHIIGSLIDGLGQFINTAGKLVLMTAITCVGVNFLVGEQYLSVILPGESFKDSFDKMNLPRTRLTRTLNDAGAAVNSIIPWSVSGVFIQGALQVSPIQYIPYSFFPLLVPFFTVFVGFILEHKKRTLK
ncbi:Na+/H+ antiporter NhaC [Companilactobacillus halodurans]|uniref:Na+/H+ antiporter NhaC n=1 Tax=Companilactobacillus halodurans TaxID=2584183 RepID=A0A5P0ZZC2_9LACO|nr:Na+/H+ antiporter NhaC [Companilactobacillus halodurans]MQS76711.1 Na+/H+ antiporter NhaC [Companilactobacillus halodurans]MQS98094.1 Na+/H+ antiporter NhaC [Companilactobacillus halodurans]